MPKLDRSSQSESQKRHGDSMTLQLWLEQNGVSPSDAGRIADSGVFESPRTKCANCRCAINLGYECDGDVLHLCSEECAEEYNG